MTAIQVWAVIAVWGLTATVRGYSQPIIAATQGGELVRNGDFETAPASATKADAGDMDEPPGWSAVGGSKVARDAAAPPGPAGPYALRLTVDRLGGHGGAANDGGGRMAVRDGAWYDVSFFCRTEDKRHTGLVFSLESRDGHTVCARVTLPEVGGDWQAYTLSLHAGVAATRARLIISPIDPGVLWLDGVSVVPRPAH